MAKHNSDLFYTCSLIEYIGRERKLKRSQVVRAMGEKNIRRIYQYADVFHCEPIAKTADDFITDLEIPEGISTMYRPAATRSRTTGRSDRSTSD